MQGDFLGAAHPAVSTRPRRQPLCLAAGGQLSPPKSPGACFLMVDIIFTLQGINSQPEKQRKLPTKTM